MDAQGGEAANILGCQFGLTGGVLMYSMLKNKGFRFFPFNSANL